MNNPIVKRQDFIIRQLELISQRQSCSASEALAELKKHLPTTWQNSLMHSEQIVSGTRNIGGLSEVLKDVGGQANFSILQKYRSLRDEYSEALTMVVEGGRTTTVYSGFLIAVAAVVYLLYGWKVLPSLWGLQEEINPATFPAFTQFVMDVGRHIFGILLLLIAGAAMSRFFLNQSLASRLERFLPIADTRLNRTLLGPVDFINRFIASLYIQLYLAGGVVDKDALERALNSIKRQGGGALSDLVDWQCSAELGTLTQESEVQTRQLAHELVMRLARFRQGFNLIIQVLLFTMIGNMVVALYLPIFLLGESL